MKTDLEVLEGTLSRLRTTGWQKYGSGELDGPNCLMGAVSYEVGWRKNAQVQHHGWGEDRFGRLDQYDRMQRILKRSLSELFPENPLGVVAFNDSDGTEFVQVEQLLEKTIVQVQEKVEV